MNNTELLKQSLESGRSLFENAYTAWQALQDQTEKMTNTWLDQSPWVNDEVRANLDKWTAAYKDGQNHVKAAIDSNFNTLEGYLTAS